MIKYKPSNMASERLQICRTYLERILFAPKPIQGAGLFIKLEAIFYFKIPHKEFDGQKVLEPVCQAPIYSV